MKLVATYDNEDYYGLRSLFILNLKSSDYSIKYILAVLNSKLMTQYVLSKGLIRYAKGKQPQIRIAGLKKIPIKYLTNQLPLTHLANYLLFLNATEERRESEKELIEFIDKEIIDSLVYELYFEEELGTNLFEFVEPYLMDIEKIGDDEARLKAIEEVVEKIRKDGKVTREIERMKGHEWVRVMEGKDERCY